MSFRIRTYSATKPTPFVDVWLIGADGPAEFQLLHGELIASIAEELAAWFTEKGVKVEREERQYVATSCKPGTPDQGKVTEPSLFSEAPG